MKNDNLVNGIDLFSDPLKFYSALLSDIEKATKSIYIEIYKFGTDTIGTKFRDTLTRKAKEGVEVKLLVDSWGASFSASFFSELVRHGGELRFFQKFRFTFDAFTRHHRRNHRKIFIIDNDISYIGSANINDYSLNWRELILRIRGPVAIMFRRAFFASWKIYKRGLFNIRLHTRTLSFGGFKLYRDVPSIRKQSIRKKIIEMIRQARHEIIIETPYFLPGFLFRKALMDAGRRGVNVQILTPLKSDVGIVDLLRSKYLGMLYHANVKLRFYSPYNLHSKMIMTDRAAFMIGSTNIDYRSFRYMHEVMLYGTNKDIIQALSDHYAETQRYCEDFDYAQWQNRPVVHRFFEWLLIPFRHLL